MGLPLVVLWTPGFGRELARRLICGEGLEGLGLPSHGSRVVNHCRSCGSTEHGQPTLIPAPGSVATHVSISYAEDLTVVALTGAGPVGLDVERSEAVDFPGFDDVAAHADEALDGVGPRTLTWVRKESLLKATGRGLTVDPREIFITAPSQLPALIKWDATDPPESPVWMQDVEVTRAHVAAVSVLAQERPELVVRRVDLAAQPR